MPDALLFQYGSNMHLPRFLDRLIRYAHYAPAGIAVEAEAVGLARLDEWTPRGNLWSAGQARRGEANARALNIVRDTGGVVWGVVYRLDVELVERTDGERSLLDRIEGHRPRHDPENYRKLRVTVSRDGVPIEVWTYVGTDEAVVRCERDHPGTCANDAYIEAVMAGAEAAGVPARDQQTLRQALTGQA